MRAVFVESPNADDPLAALRVGDFPDPAPEPGWVRVRMQAASLNWHDIWTLRGLGAANGRPERFPMILGCDGVGTLDDGTPVVIYPVVNAPGWMGDETLDPDRQTFSEYLQGTMAEHTMVPARNAVPLPAGLSIAAAAVLGASWITAYRMIFTLSGLRAGQTMLVQGASGGVAAALIQMGRAAGYRVWVTGRSAEKRALAEKLGAHETFASNEPLPAPVDVVFDPVGKATWAHSLASTKIGGTIVVCGVPSGNHPELDIARVFIDQITIRGVYAGTLAEFRDTLSFIAAAGIEPYVGATMPLAKAHEAFRLMTAGNTPAKIVLTI